MDAKAKDIERNFDDVYTFHEEIQNGNLKTFYELEVKGQ